MIQNSITNVWLMFIWTTIFSTPFRKHIISFKLDNFTSAFHLKNNNINFNLINNKEYNLKIFDILIVLK